MLNRGGDADDVLREVVAILHERLEPLRAASASSRRASSCPGRRPADDAARHGASRSRSRAAAWPSSRWAASCRRDDRALLERVAVLVSPYALVGWDTGGEAWGPVVRSGRRESRAADPRERTLIMRDGIAGRARPMRWRRTGAAGPAAPSPFSHVVVAPAAASIPRSRSPLVRGTIPRSSDRSWDPEGSKYCGSCLEPRTT